jgi:hypothetical protein
MTNYEEYFNSMRDDELKKILLSQDVSTIENILQDKTTQLIQLQNLKKQKKLDFGPKVKVKQVHQELITTMNEINDWLNIENISTPGLVYPEGIFSARVFMPSRWVKKPRGSNGMQGNFSIYDVDLKIMYIFSGKLPKVKSDVAHEYTHHVQCEVLFSGMPDFENQRKDNFSKFRTFMEGHARGIERVISNKYAGLNNDGAFLYDSVERAVNELKRVYVWCSGMYDKKMDLDLLLSRTSYDGPLEEEFFEPLAKNKTTPSNHDLGNSLFLIYEQKHGDSMYKDIMHKKFSF